MRITEQVVSAKQAGVFLDNALDNRPVKKAHLNNLVRAQEMGIYKQDPKPLVFDHNGKLVDGQHRLLAQVRTGISHKYFVCHLEKGESALDVRMHEASSRPHSNVDLLRFDNPKRTNFAAWTATTKMLYHLNTSVVPTQPVNYYDLRATLKKHETNLLWAIELATTAQLRRLTPASFTAFCVWAMTPGKKGTDIGTSVKKFAERYVSGVGLNANDPEMILRNYMLQRENVDRVTELSHFASALVSSLQGKNRYRSMRSRTAFEDIAELIGKDCPSWVRGRTNKDGNGVKEDVNKSVTKETV